jgi:hypothetical protein
MSVARTQREISSAEFAEWMAFYWAEAEMMGLVKGPPTPEQLGDKLAAWAAAHNARMAAAKPKPGVSAIADESGPRRDDGAARRGVSR